MFTAGAIAAGVAANEFGLTRLLTDYKNKRNSELENRLNVFSEKERQQLKIDFVDKLFLPPTPQEIAEQFDYLNRVSVRFSKRTDNIFNFASLIVDGRKVNSSLVVNRNKLINDQVRWFIPGLETVPFNEKIVEENEVSIFVGEPNAEGVFRSTDGFDSNVLNILLLKQLSAFAAVKFLSSSSFDKKLEDKSIDLKAFSAGTNAALAIVEHLPTKFKSVSLEAGIFNIFDDYFKDLYVKVISGKGDARQLAAWMGADLLLSALDSLSYLPQLSSDVRRLMILCSPYIWVDKIPANSMRIKIVHGRQDSITPFSQSEQLYSKLKSLGWDAKMLDFTAYNLDHIQVSN